MTTLREALELTLDALDSFGREANWGASCLSAETIRKINEAPSIAAQALADNPVDADKRERVAQIIEDEAWLRRLRLPDRLAKKWGEEDKHACIDRLLDRLRAPRVDEGWVLVPREPTEAMIAACLSALSDWRKTLDADERMLRRDPERLQRNGKPFEASATSEEKARLRYHAMIAAALLEPKP